MPINLWPFRRRASYSALLGYYLSTDGDLPSGYHRLLDSPEIGACINRIASIISSCTIFLMRNTDAGDRREKNRLSRFVDIDPWPGHGTRQSWMTWIVSTMLAEGDGNALLLPHFDSDGNFTALEPMPGAVLIPPQPGTSYKIQWLDRIYSPDQVVHFRLFADELQPWKGRGYRVQASAVAGSLSQTAALKQSLSNPRYKPPLVVTVNSDTDLSSDEARDAFREKFLEESAEGKPWILPADLVKVEQIKPLSLSDLAVKDTLDLDKRSAASIFGVPPFLLGLGSFNKDEYNTFIRTVVVPICTGIEQELTLKLLYSPELYFVFNRRRLYSYDIQTLVNMDLAMSDRGFMTGDEVREDAYRDPAGLDEFRVLENYIPWDMAAQQSKLQQN